MPENVLFTTERFKEIEDYLKKHQRATVEELSKMLYVSEATIRRDLNEMQKLGMVKRTHGGALLTSEENEPNIFVRIEKNASDKEKTATIAFSRLPAFNTIFIDNSSTCLALAEKMDFQYKTIVTTGLHLAMKFFNKPNVKIIFLGGVVQYVSYSTDGCFANDMLSRFRFDLSLVSCASIQMDGSYEPTLETMELKSNALKRSNQKILLADKNKFSFSQPYRTCSLSDYDAIYTNACDQTILAYKENGINIFNH